MSPAQAIILGSVVIAASIVFVSTSRPAEAERVGPFQLMHHSNNLANTSVFRLDTSTGDVSYCWITGPGDLRCEEESRAK